MSNIAEALKEAAQSLETISKNAGKFLDSDGEENMLRHYDQVRGYANSRATVARQALAAHEAAKERTGWPADGRMAQDDSRELSKWLSNTPGARRLVDEAAKPASILTQDEIDGLYAMHSGDGGPTDICEQFAPALIRAVLAAPVAVASPLSDEQLLEILGDVDADTKRLPPGVKAFARAIEAHHGIKEQA